MSFSASGKMGAILAIFSDFSLFKLSEFRMVLGLLDVESDLTFEGVVIFLLVSVFK